MRSGIPVEPIALLRQSPQLASAEYKLYGDEPTRYNVVEGVEIHPLGELVVNIIERYDFRSIVDHPCSAHRDIMPSVLRVLKNVHGDGYNVNYTCIDTDSAQLAESYRSIKSAVGSLSGTRYLRRKAMPMESATGISGTPLADLFFSWKNGFFNDTERLQAALMDARVSGAAIAMFGAVPIGDAHWTQWQDAIQAHKISATEVTKFADAPFPYPKAILAISKAYSSKQFMVVYNVALIPQPSNLLSTMREKLKDKIKEEMNAANSAGIA